MSSRPGFFLYGNDLYTDTALCCASTVGIWTLMLVLMNKQGSGTLADTELRLRKAVRCTKRELGKALDELKENGIAEINRPKTCDLITITSERMQGYLDDLERKKANERKRQNRLKDTESTDSVTEPVDDLSDSEPDALTRAPVSEARARDKEVPSDEEVEEIENGSPRARGSPGDPVEVYKRITGNECPIYFQELIRVEIGDDPEKVALWGAVCEVWRDTKKWNDRQVRKMVDDFKSQLERSKKNGRPNGETPAETFRRLLRVTGGS